MRLTGKRLMIPGGMLFCVLLLVLVETASGSGGPKCTIVGTEGADTLHGKPGPDVICGRGGNDRIAGGRGADRIVGGSGNDELAGGPGKDALLGGRGHDSCHDSAATVFVSCEQGSHSESSQPLKPSASHPHPLTVRPSLFAYHEPPGEEAPSAVYFSFQRRFVDTSFGDATVGVYMEAWDPSGISSISVEIDGPSGPWHDLQLAGGPDPRSVIEDSIDVPSLTPAGDYRLASLTISDKMGNTRTLSATEIREAGWSEFEVFDGPDDEGP